MTKNALDLGSHDQEQPITANLVKSRSFSLRSVAVLGAAIGLNKPRDLTERVKHQSNMSIVAVLELVQEIWTKFEDIPADSSFCS